MKFLFLTLALSLSLSACTRVPVGTFSAADGSTAAPAVVDANSNIEAERDLNRLRDIDSSIDAGLARLDAALDPNSAPANLDKLVTDNDLDPALASDPNFRRQIEVENKFNEKNQSLIDDELTGNLDNVNENTATSPDEFNDLQRQQQAEIDQKLDEKAQDAVAQDSDEQQDNDASTEAEDSSSFNNSESTPEESDAFSDSNGEPSI